MDHPTGWWHYKEYCRKIQDLRDRLRGMEEQIVVKEGLLEDYRESTSSLRAMVQKKLGRREEEDTGTTITGINTSILM